MNESDAPFVWPAERSRYRLKSGVFAFQAPFDMNINGTHVERHDWVVKVGPGVHHVIVLSPGRFSELYEPLPHPDAWRAASGEETP